MPVGYEVLVYYKDLADEFSPGGQGGLWMEMVAQQMLAEAIMECPVYEGTLAASHTVDRTAAGPGFFGNQYVANFAIVNWAEHAEWVHQGVDGIITPASADYMVIPPNRGWRRSKRAAVRGQTANPWLDRACTRVAARFGATPVSLAF